MKKIMLLLLVVLGAVWGTMAAPPKNPPPVPVITHECWITHNTGTSVVVNFVTDKAGPVAVEYRKPGEKTWQRAYELLGGQQRIDRSKHTVKLENLQPGTLYQIRPLVFKDPDVMDLDTVSGKVVTIRTFSPETRRFTAFYTSDTQFPVKDRIARLRKFNRECGANNVDLYFHGGDIANIFEDAEKEMLTAFADVVSEDITHLPTLCVNRGNHEYRGRQCQDFMRFFCGPEQKSFYGFRNGDVCFIVLDSGEDKPRNVKHHYYARNFEDSWFMEQRKWLEEYVKTPEFLTARFRVVLAHSPAHEGYMYDRLNVVCQGIITGEKPEHQIHLWVSGHRHRYARQIQRDSAKYRVFESSAPLTDYGTRPFITLINGGPNNRNFPTSTGLMFAFTAEKIEVRAMKLDGEVFDHFEIYPDGSLKEIRSDLKIQWREPGKR